MEPPYAFTPLPEGNAYELRCKQILSDLKYKAAELMALGAPVPAEITAIIETLTVGGIYTYSMHTHTTSFLYEVKIPQLVSVRATKFPVKGSPQSLPEVSGGGQ